MPTDVPCDRGVSMARWSGLRAKSCAQRQSPSPLQPACWPAPAPAPFSQGVRQDAERALPATWSRLRFAHRCSISIFALGVPVRAGARRPDRPAPASSPSTRCSSNSPRTRGRTARLAAAANGDSARGASDDERRRCPSQQTSRSACPSSALRTESLWRKWNALSSRLAVEAEDAGPLPCPSRKAARPPPHASLASRHGGQRPGQGRRASPWSTGAVSTPPSATRTISAGTAPLTTGAAPLETFSDGRGDCEDYAFAKLVALRESGMATADLRLLLVRDLVSRQDHAVLAARHDGHWLVPRQPLGRSRRCRGVFATLAAAVRSSTIGRRRDCSSPLMRTGRRTRARPTSSLPRCRVHRGSTMTLAL